MLSSDAIALALGASSVYVNYYPPQGNNIISIHVNFEVEKHRGRHSYAVSFEENVNTGQAIKGLRKAINDRIKLNMRYSDYGHP